jgi:cytochrome c peroxidase
VSKAQGKRATRLARFTAALERYEGVASSPAFSYGSSRRSPFRLPSAHSTCLKLHTATHIWICRVTSRTRRQQKFDNTPADNPVTDAGATLGRVLFYDTRLSANSTVSCGSCHVQSHAFVDPNRFSKGFEGGLTDRHAMNLVNLRFHPRARFFWDERSGNLEAMVLMPVENRLEMGQDLSSSLAFWPRSRSMPSCFAAPSRSGDHQRADRARARAVSALDGLVSVDVRCRPSAGPIVTRRFPQLHDRGESRQGPVLRNCSLCHLPDQDAHFVMTEPVNTGLDEDTARTDGGVGDITLKPNDIGRFKSPSLRNVEVTAPYMHDGRFATLDAVLDHYSNGGRIIRTRMSVCSRCISRPRKRRR